MAAGQLKGPNSCLEIFQRQIGSLRNFESEAKFRK